MDPGERTHTLPQRFCTSASRNAWPAAAAAAVKSLVLTSARPLSQFLAILAIFAPVVWWADWVFFHFRVLPTRVVHDLAPKTHRF